MAGGREFDIERFRETILLVAEESREDPRFGATRLNKILYFSDFKAFAMFGKSITGATYVRGDRGPVPQEISSTLDEMKTRDEIDREERTYFNYRLKVISARRAPQLVEVLAEREVDLVRAVMRETRAANTYGGGPLSHLETGWRLERYGEVIPYESAYISDRRPTPTELRVWREGVNERRAQRV